jgi:hypothetical protein
MEVTTVLPPGEEKSLDSGILAELIRQAIYRTLEDLKSLQVPQSVRTVSRPDEHGIHIDEIMSPNYRDEVVWDRIAQIWKSQESTALTDYLWDRAALKITFSGPDPDKDSWARAVYGDLVHDPLLVVLEDAERENLVDRGVSEPWIVEDAKIEKVIEDVAAYYCGREQLITAICPLSKLEQPPGTCLDVAPDIKLRRLTLREISLFMLRHPGEYLWEDFKAPYVVETVAEVSFPIERGKAGRGDIFSLVQDRLDLLKWALMITLNRDEPVGEGACLIKGRLDKRLGRFQRDENMGVFRFSLNETAVDRCVSLIKHFRESAVQASDLNQAIWHFGRACVASLPRDILLESVIGLDSLLVPGPGDSRYRFRLHGAAILSTNREEGGKYFRILGEMWDERSQAAHGQRAKEVERLAPISRKILAEVICKIVNLILKQKLDLPDRLSRAIERYVLEKATS